jgi:hypothetical protein
VQGSLTEKHLLLEIPKLLRKVYVINVRIFETANFLPELIDLTLTIRADLLRGGRLVHTFAILEDRHQKLS